MKYPPQLVDPMREELTRLGIEELRTPEEVEEVLDDQEGSVMVVVNSVCGCAAQNARPAVELALEHDVTPDHSVTVFAGQDAEATEKAREFFTGYRPSSPQIALFSDGSLRHMIQRHEIEGRGAEEIAGDLKEAFEEHCGAVA